MKAQLVCGWTRSTFVFLLSTSTTWAHLGCWCTCRSVHDLPLTQYFQTINPLLTHEYSGGVLILIFLTNGQTSRSKREHRAGSLAKSVLAIKSEHEKTLRARRIDYCMRAKVFIALFANPGLGVITKQ